MAPTADRPGPRTRPHRSTPRRALTRRSALHRHRAYRTTVAMLLTGVALAGAVSCGSADPAPVAASTPAPRRLPPSHRRRCSGR